MSAIGKFMDRVIQELLQLKKEVRELKQKLEELENAS